MVSQTVCVVMQLNDCLLYTSYYGSVQSSGLKVNYELPLSSIKVSIPRAEDYRNEFSIISVKRSFTLSARYVKTVLLAKKS
jgi:FYVE/RhoGEF/PH domain-containing protein 5/6